MEKQKESIRFSIGIFSSTVTLPSAAQRTAKPIRLSTAEILGFERETSGGEVVRG